jgi:preprotein translocase subunit SecF
MITRQLISLPITLFILSVAILLYNFYTTGEFFLRDIDLKGGTLITIETSKPVDTKLLENRLSKEYGSVLISSLKTSTGYGANIEVSENVNADNVISSIKNLGVDVISFSVESIGSSLGELFFSQLVYVLTVGFVLMSIVIFIIYRNPVSSFAIVFASLSNILATLAFTSLIGIKISFAGLAGLLMLIAYTVDTNIVLTSKVIRSDPEEFPKKYKRAFITGITLIITITITMIVVYFLSTSKLLTNIASVLVIGFITDLPFTWIFNANVLEWWIRRKYKA